MAKKRILSGMRPSGKLHLGNYAGALENWIKLQDDFENFFFVADWHALTTNPDAAFGITENTREMVIDWLSAGIKPENPIFIHHFFLQPNIFFAISDCGTGLDILPLLCNPLSSGSSPT